MALVHLPLGRLCSSTRVRRGPSLGDVDGDGDFDLVEGIVGAGQLLLLGDGTGGLPAGLNFSTDLSDDVGCIGGHGRGWRLRCGGG